MGAVNAPHGGGGHGATDASGRLQAVPGHAAARRDGGRPVIHSTDPSIAPKNPVQRDLSRACTDCGAPVRRARRARGPLPARCPACAAARRPRDQLRAYLRSAVRLADAQGLPR